MFPGPVRLATSGQMSFSKNRKLFDAMCARAVAEQNRDARIELTKKAIRFAVANPTGYYSSDVLEGILLEVAQDIDAPMSASPRQGTVLHVMTECYFHGGHTRVVERWMELDRARQHSLVFTAKENQKIPSRLMSAVEKAGGTITRLADSDSYLKKAADLRTLASEFQFVVLHVHMFDIIPLLAFGTERFQRPVVLFNHADFLFSVGVSVADRFVDVSNSAAGTTIRNRGVADPYVLPIPMDIDNAAAQDSIGVLRRLVLPRDKKIVLTAGHAHKYTPYKTWSFAPLAAGILEKEDRVLLGVGPSDHNPYWRKISRRYKGRVFGTGPVPYGDFKACLCIADIVVDSHPMSGGTAMVDAVKLGKPVVSLHSPDGQMDFTRNSPAYCASKEELFAKVDVLLSDAAERERHVAQVAKRLEETHSVDIWKKKVEQLYADLDETVHKLRRFASVPNSQPTDLEVYLNRYNQRSWYQSAAGAVYSRLRSLLAPAGR